MAALDRGFDYPENLAKCPRGPKTAERNPSVTLPVYCSSNSV